MIRSPYVIELRFKVFLGFEFVSCTKACYGLIFRKNFPYHSGSFIIFAIIYLNFKKC